MESFLLFDIGCIECGQDSQPVGIFKTLSEAEKAREEYLTGEANQFGTVWGRKEWFGQHEVSIYDMSTKKEVQLED